MQKNKILRLIFILFALVGISAYVSGLFIDVTRDAGLYATISKEIFKNGNLINLTIHGEPYDQKPPLLFWLGALGFVVGEVSSFWFKFPVFLLVLAGIYWAFRLGESMYNRKTGIVTAIILFSSFIYLLYTMDIHTDTPLQAFVTLALWQLFEFLKTGKNKNLLWGFIAIGLAMLSKGPIGAAIPAFAVVGHILLKKDYKQLADYRWYLGIFIALLVSAPAIIGLMNQFGWEGLRFYFWDNMVGRVTGSYVKAVNDPVFYVHNLLYQLFPWSLLFYAAVFFEFRMLIKNRFRSNEYFTFTGIWIYFIIINSASSQLPNYVFPIVPLMAVLAAKWMVISSEKISARYNLLFYVQAGMVALSFVALLLVSLYIFPAPEIWFWAISLAGLISIWYIYKYVKVLLVKLVAPSVIAAFVVMLFLNTHVFPFLFSFQSTGEAARYVNENAGEGDKLFDYKHQQYEIFFYSEIEAKQLSSFNEVKSVAGEEGNWIYTNAEGLSELKNLSAKPDTVIEYRHLDLSRPAKFINPRTRQEALQLMYLVKY